MNPNIIQLVNPRCTRATRRPAGPDVPALSRDLPVETRPRIIVRGAARLKRPLYHRPCYGFAHIAWRLFCWQFFRTGKARRHGSPPPSLPENAALKHLRPVLEHADQRPRCRARLAPVSNVRSFAAMPDYQMLSSQLIKRPFCRNPGHIEYRRQLLFSRHLVTERDRAVHDCIFERSVDLMV